MSGLSRSSFGDGGELASGEVQRDRLHVDALRWQAARMAPKRWGERIQANVMGADDGPVQAEVNARAKQHAQELAESMPPELARQLAAHTRRWLQGQAPVLEPDQADRLDQ